jgi:hypothetical protein
MQKKVIILSPSTGLANRFKAQVLEGGRVVRETPWSSNLILENGMNRIATDVICNLFTHCAIGSGTTPTQDDSGAFTATTSGTTVTASGGFFTVGDVGKLLRFDTGEKSVITAYTSDTIVEVADTLGVGVGTLFTLYRIQQTGLDTEIKRTANYLTGAGNCESTYSGGVYTHRRTFDFTEETGSVSYNEVGFSHTATVAANLNMRGIFAGAPIGVVSGQQLRVIYDVLVTVTPVSPRDREVVISGWPALETPVAVDESTDLIGLVAHGFAAETKIVLTGTVAPGNLAFATPYYVVSNNADSFKLSATPRGGAIDITSNGTGVILLTNTKGVEQLTTHRVSSINTTGATTCFVSSATTLNEPHHFSFSLGTATDKRMAIVTDSTNIPAFPVASPVSYTPPTGGDKALTKDSYTTGSYVVRWRATFATTAANSALIRKFFLHDLPSGGSFPQNGLTYLFNHAQEKSNLFTLTVVWKFNWDRDFV